MAYTCSYTKDGDLYTNQNCFSRLTYCKDWKKAAIVIEKEKQYFPIPKIEEYIKDISEMVGVECTIILERTIKVEFERPTVLKVKAFTQAIRYLWEGKYMAEIIAGNLYDPFYKIVEYYFKLKELLPNEPILTLFCVAFNIFVKEGIYFNSNHTWSSEGGCKILTDFNSNEKYLNIYCKAPRAWKNKVEYPKTNEEFINFYNKNLELLC